MVPTGVVGAVDEVVLAWARACGTVMDMAPDEQETVDPVVWLLRRARSLFRLSDEDLAELCAVDTSAVERWERTGGVPEVATRRLASLVSVAGLLEARVPPGQLPVVARRRADALGGATVLDLVGQDRGVEAAQLISAALDWSRTA